MHPTLGSTLARMRRYEEVLALRLPADLYIMTDDGTRGDEVLAMLNPAALPRLRFWRNGIGLERLRPATAAERSHRRRALAIPEDALVLMTASRLASWKRVDRAVTALPRVLESIPSAVLVIVGDGEERPNLQRLAAELGVAHAVRFVGAVPQEQVAEFMQAADVFLAIADLSNVGNPLLEAMASGLAVIAVDAGATRDLIVDGETGRLASSGDPQVMAGVIEHLARDDALRSLLGTGARRYAEEHFWTWEARLDAELTAVEQLVVARTASSSAEVVHAGLR
jgi:phosphatidylinositol alpha-1,6-mannosyltransferase